MAHVEGQRDFEFELPRLAETLPEFGIIGNIETRAR